MKALLPLLVLLAPFASAQPPALRIALRLDTDHALLIGPELQTADESQLSRHPKSPLHADLQPGESIYLFDHPSPWRPGDRWQLYPGIPIRIDQLGVITYCGGIGGYEIAIAHSDAPLRRDVFLGRAPRPTRDPLVAEPPLEPLTNLPAAESSRLIALLAKEARDLVKTEDWGVEANQSPAFSARVRRANRAVLSGNLPAPQIRAQRWTPPSGAPLLFVEAVWLAPDGAPVFAADAVFQQGAQLAFAAGNSKLMRMQEFEDRDWRLSSPSVFLGAWEIDGRRYILRYGTGLESFTVELMELVPVKGLVPTGISFSAGC